MSQSTESSRSGLGRWVGLGAGIVFVVVLGAGLSAGSVELYSLSVPVWAVMVVSYLLGAAAMWGGLTSRKE